MGSRYLVTGTQLGVLIALSQLNPEQVNKDLNRIVETQFVWESEKTLDEDIRILQQKIKETI